MRITVNGEDRETADATVAALLESLGLARQAVAVEVNREVIPKAQHPSHPLHEGDRVELVTLVGGG